MSEEKRNVRMFCELAADLLKMQPRNAATSYAIRTILRAAINKSCPNYHGNNNKKNVRYQSLSAAKASKENQSDQTVVDHAMPVAHLLEHIRTHNLTDANELFTLVPKYSIMVLITKEEHRRLEKDHDLKKTMPVGWDGQDILARYRTAGIELVEL
jgi:hypothetical protein